MRVHELAKELKLDSKALIPDLKEMGFDVKSHMSSLSEEQTEEARSKFGGTKPEKTVKKVSKKKTGENSEKTVTEAAVS